MNNAVLGEARYRAKAPRSFRWLGLINVIPVVVVVLFHVEDRALSEVLRQLLWKAIGVAMVVSTLRRSRQSPVLLMQVVGIVIILFICEQRFSIFLLKYQRSLLGYRCWNQLCSQNSSRVYD